MGTLLSSRSNSSEEDFDIISNNAYRYPPKSGNYFGTHFIMGGERFDMSQPEAYLFGENSDLNFLGSKPVQFPYPTPTGNEPTKPLRSLVNIRKDSLRFVKIEDAESVPLDDGKKEVQSNRYNIEFTFDSDVRCAITIYYFATEDINNGQIAYHPRDPAMNSETYHYKRGANQLFTQSAHIVDPSKNMDEEWQYCPNKEAIPIVISCVVEDDDHPCHSHITYAIVEKSSADGGFLIKPLKQKQFVDGVLYLLQEIYGIENKQTDRSKLDPDDDVEDSGAECVICMSDMRDTLILPCRHLCLCSTCAESLRYQASSCPICRSPFRALLQIRAMRKKQPTTVQPGENGEENPVSQEGVPQGYEAVSLIEAVNGPCSQLFTVDGGLQLTRYPQGDMDTGMREKKRSSKRHVISVKSDDSVVNTNVTLKADDKKALDEEEESRKKDDPLEVVRMERKSPKKEKVALGQYSDCKDSTDESNTSKVVNVSEDYSTDTLDSKDMSNHNVELRVYESEPDSDYDIQVKPIQMAHEQTSTENLADDEREDSSEAEQEIEPDYDDDEEDEEDDLSLVTETTQTESQMSKSTASPTSLESQDRGVTYVKGLSQSMGAMDRDIEGYQPLQLGSNLSLPGHSNSSTEASSFGSTHSSHGLLPGGAGSDDDKS